MRSNEHPQVRRNIALLANIREATGAGDRLRTRSFGNIIELGIEALVLETNREYDVGTPLVVNVVFPGQPRGDDPFAHLHCVVRKVHDRPSLHYDLAIVEMDARTRGRLETYLLGSLGPSPRAAEGI